MADLTFTYVEAEDDSVDSCYEISRDGVDLGDIQCCEDGRFAVNSYSGEGEGFAMTNYGEFDTFAEAKAKALVVFAPVLN